MSLIRNDLITASRLAEMCGVTRKTVYRLVESEKAPGHEVMPDDRIYFVLAEAEAFARAWRKRKDSARRARGGL